MARENMDETKFIELLKRIGKEYDYDFITGYFKALKKSTNKLMLYGCLYSLLDLYETKCIRKKLNNEYEELMDAKNWLLDFTFTTRS